eukprot:g1369.t1
MGCGSSGPAASPQEIAANKAVEAQMGQDREAARRVFKVLLLGAGESGKSTLFKQMRVIYGEGFSEQSRKAFRTVLHANVVAAIQMLLQAETALTECRIEGIEVSEANKALAQSVAALVPNEFLDAKLAQNIGSLWEDPGIQKRFANRHLFPLSDSAEYFLNKTTEICKDDFIPSLDDVFRARVQTQGIVEDIFVLDKQKGDTISMFDVGGQRSERRHWLHCFEDVTALLFVAALSEYDMVLFEDASTNRMQESLNLFEDICESRWFANTSIILFLNKRDLFEDKIKKVPLSVCFEEYQGGAGDAETAMEFIKTQFKARNQNKNNNNKEIVVHYTTATDTNLVRTVFESVKVFFLRGVLADSGLMM